jgi:hypothetical protein
VELFADPTCGDGTRWCDAGEGVASLHIAPGVGNDRMWFSRGYLRLAGSQSGLVFFPPLAALYPSPFGTTACAGCRQLADGQWICGYEFAGLGEDVTVDRFTGDAYAKNGCLKRVYRLRYDSILD